MQGLGEANNYVFRDSVVKLFSIITLMSYRLVPDATDKAKKKKKKSY